MMALTPPYRNCQNYSRVNGGCRPASGRSSTVIATGSKRTEADMERAMRAAPTSEKYNYNLQKGQEMGWQNGAEQRR